MVASFRLEHNIGLFPVSFSLTVFSLLWQWRERSAGLFGWDPGQDYSMCNGRLLPKSQGEHGPGRGEDSQPGRHCHQAWGEMRRWEDLVHVLGHCPVSWIFSQAQACRKSTLRTNLVIVDSLYFRLCADMRFVLGSISSLTFVLLSGKKVQIRKPAPAQTDIAPLRRSSRPVIISSSTLKKNMAQHRPLRERLLHLLALKPYNKPELILRLQRDGLQQSDKDCLNSHLQQVQHILHQ